jgi:hypothetical protein
MTVDDAGWLGYAGGGGNLPPGGMETRRIVIFAAMRQEADAIARALGVRQLEEGVYGGRLGDREIAMVVIGIGAKRLPRLLCAGAAVVIVAGLAGGLDPSLRTGDVVIDPGRGTIHTSTRMVCTVADKAALFGATGAACVEMETSVVREAVGAVTGVRAILDPADEELPREVLTLTDANGRVKLGAVLGLLVRRPRMIGRLMRLRRGSKVALRALGEAVRELVEQH